MREGTAAKILLDTETTIRLFRALVAAARARNRHQYVQAIDEVHRQGREQAVPVGLLSTYLVRIPAYPDWPGGVVDMTSYITKIRTAYRALSDFLDHNKISYEEFGAAVGSWATNDHTIDAGIAMTCQIAFLSVQWPAATDEPGDEELADELHKVMSFYNG